MVEKPASAILCIDCSYGSGRPYYHAEPHCAGARYLPEVAMYPQPEEAATYYLACWDYGDECHADLCPLSLHQTFETAEQAAIKHLEKLGIDRWIGEDIDRVRVFPLRLDP